MGRSRVSARARAKARVRVFAARLPLLWFVTLSDHLDRERIQWCFRARVVQRYGVAKVGEM
jgi:hypothetical protein